MTLRTTTGLELRLPRGTRITAAREALRRAGWRLVAGPRGRIVAEPLH